MNLTAPENATSEIHETDSDESYYALGRLIKQPMVRYFVITGILAFIAVILLAIHCVLDHIEQRRALEQDRKLSFGPAPSGNTRLPRPSQVEANTSRKMAFPFVLRNK